MCKDSSEMLIFRFGSQKPDVASMPNLILESGFESQKILLDLLPGKLGMWPDGPMYDNNGLPLTLDRNTPEDCAKEFYMWGHPRNQEVVTEYLGVRDSVPFALFMKLETPIHILIEMYRDFELLSSNTLLYEELMAFLPKWIALIGWGVVQLEQEGEFTFVVTIDEKSGLLLSIQDRAADLGIECWELVELDDKIVWRNRTIA